MHTLKWHWAGFSNCIITTIVNDAINGSELYTGSGVGVDWKSLVFKQWVKTQVVSFMSLCTILKDGLYNEDYCYVWIKGLLNKL